MTEVMTECYRVLKPGAHGLVWALPRTSHWTATALENAGFEVRDVVTHLFGTGFPKSLDISKAIHKAAGAEREVVGQKPYSNQDTRGNPISETGGRGTGLGQGKPRLQLSITAPATNAAKQWQGWGTALKPASEHWILVRKPLSEKTVAANVLKHGVGGINIDASRIGTDTISTHGGGDKLSGMKGNGNSGVGTYQTHTGRFPANLILDEGAAEALDKQSGVSKPKPERTGPRGGRKNIEGGWDKDFPGTWPADPGGGASRFFYVAKASKSDKGEDNTHPTVKSTALMTYLIKLVTPPGGVVLDPFMGSGSTGVSAIKSGFKFIGIEMSRAYVRIAVGRMKKT